MPKSDPLIRRILNSQEILFLGIFSFLTRFFNLSFPPKVVFDEAHFGLYATKYFSHQYYFDIHPPLGKMLLALAGFFGRIKPGFDFEVGSLYGEFNFLSMRILSAFFGSALVLLIYFFVKRLGFSRRIAFLASFMVLFDNALIVQSRFILMDIILIFFIFLSLYLFLLSKKYTPLSSKWYLSYIACALSLGAAISIKWTGFGVLGIVWFLLIFEDGTFSKPRKEFLVGFGLLFLAPFLVYFLIFTAHFYLLPLSCEKDCGAVLNAYLEPGKYGLKETASALRFGNAPPEGNIFEKFKMAQSLMLGSNLNIVTNYYYDSEWWSWPLMARPFRYFLEKQDAKSVFIYFLGNPIIWWSALIGIIGYLYLMIRNFIFKFRMKLPEIFYSKNISILIFGYLLYMIPFATIERFMLMYHYLPALIFSIILLSVFFEGAMEMIFGSPQNDKILFKNKKANIIFFGFLLIIFLSFLFFSPLTYGFPITGHQFQERMWLDIWKI